MAKKPTPNEDRSRTKDPMQPDFKRAQDNRSVQKAQGGKAQGAGKSNAAGAGKKKKK